MILCHIIIIIIVVVVKNVLIKMLQWYFIWS